MCHQYVSLQKLGRDFLVFPVEAWCRDNMFQTAIVRNHNLTVTGGTKTLILEMLAQVIMVKVVWGARRALRRIFRKRETNTARRR